MPEVHFNELTMLVFRSDAPQTRHQEKISHVEPGMLGFGAERQGRRARPGAPLCPDPQLKGSRTSAGFRALDKD
eukprot:15087487-Alexandrium_andersonii.AAC.1